MLEVRKLARHGGTRYVPLPLHILRAAGLHMGDHVTITVEKDQSIRLHRIESPEVNRPLPGAKT